jgi:hypothetical protein
VSRHYELEEVAAEHLPRGLKDPERWLRRKLNSGELRGRRYGRHWTMTQSDIEFMLQVVSNENLAPAAAPEQAGAPAGSIVDGMSARSRKRLRRVQ